MRERGASQSELDAITKRAREFYQSQRLSRSQGAAVAERENQEGANAANGCVSHLPLQYEIIADSLLHRQQDSTVDAPASSTHPSTSIAPALPEDDPPYPVTFDEIAEMIATGKPIPGIREIPTIINEEQPTEARVAKQTGAGLKPWERAA